MRKSEVERCEVVASMPAAPSSGANQSDELRLGKYRCKRRDFQLDLGWFVPHGHRHTLSCDGFTKAICGFVVAAGDTMWSAW